MSSWFRFPAQCQSVSNIPFQVGFVVVLMSHDMSLDSIVERTL